MFSSILSADVRGITGVPILIETDVSDGLPGMILVGFLASAVRESADRVRTAMKNSGISIPPKKITINFSPADLRKEGTGFDLAVAVSMLCSLGILYKEATEGVLFLGELGLDGSLKKIKGVLPMVEMAKMHGCRACVLPKENVSEGAIIEGIACVGAESLKEVMGIIFQNEYLPTRCPQKEEEKKRKETVDFSQIRGQESVKQAAKIAAAGMLNLLMIGPPGSGKTMIARRIPTILPKMTTEEQLEVTKLYSVRGLLPEHTPLLTERPFRAPHHTISAPALVGGGKIPRPGEISLAAHGCLFIDEITEMPKNVLEALRQPLEDQVVQISRVEGNYLFPANFMLVAAMNPCNCGYYPDMNRCHCTTRDIYRYLNKISMPFVDRMDLCVEAPRVAFDELTGNTEGETSDQMRARVEAAHEMQKERYRGLSIRFNSQLRGRQVEEFCKVGAKEKKLLEDAFERLNLTARSYHRLLKVARTVADLEGSALIQEGHILQAICYRNVDRKFWMG